ncbi:MAG: hypothetical protein VYC63_01560 [Verrucomicrobiota bacterium]|nr:hypothetical protein [Verrucomicrobiota bacterium]
MNRILNHKILASIACSFLINFNYGLAEENISETLKTTNNTSLATPWLQQALDELSGLPNAPKDEIASRRVTLSYIDPTRAAQLLNLHGYTIGKSEEAIDPKNLPIIVPLPGTTFHEIIPKAEEKFPQTETDPLNELVIFHNPSKPSQLSGILAKIRSEIDKPARQIIIEAMILEVSSTALDELGIKWTKAEGANNFIGSNLSSLSIGSLQHPATGAAFDLVTKGGGSGLFEELNAQVKALVREGQAEVLSRPSVLALDNRMAYINVSKELPIANTSYSTSGNYANTSFTMRKAGITLSIRPRIDTEGKEVSMQVNAEVTAKVPDADVNVRSSNGTIMASSPTISNRSVRTYVRVANNTPFIIGGLIAKDKQMTKDRIPVLGSIPIIKRLFQSKKTNTVKREVIIVLTPFVLHDETTIGKSTPMDEDVFDSFDNQLFRDAYRIRGEDTFDLNYLYENKQLQRMKDLTGQLAERNLTLVSQYPYKNFYGDAVPGEEILCYRQIYEVLKRRDIEKKINSEKIIFFEPDLNIGAGNQVMFLEKYIKQNVPEILGNKPHSKAITLSFKMNRLTEKADSIFSEPVPTISIINCPNQDSWSKTLWEMNQPAKNGQQRFTVILRNSDDIRRLKYAIVTKKAISLNTEDFALRLSNFSRGRLLLIPRVTEKDIELVDIDVARAFFYSEMYYQAQQVAMEKDINAFQRIIKEKKHLDLLKNPLSKNN